MKEHIEEVIAKIKKNRDVRSLRNSLSYEERDYLASNIDDFYLYGLTEKELITFYKQIYSVDEALAKIESTNGLMENARIIAIICLPDSLKENYVNLYDDIDVKSLFISTFDADELKLKYLMTGKYDDYVSDIISTMTNDSLKMKYINSLEGADKKANLIPYLESDTLKEKFLSNNSLIDKENYDITGSIKDENVFLKCLKFNNDENKRKLLIYRKSYHTMIMGLQHIATETIRRDTYNHIVNNAYDIPLDDYDYFSDEDKIKIFLRTIDHFGKLDDDFILKLATKFDDIPEKALVLARLEDNSKKEELLPMLNYNVSLIYSINEDRIKYSYLEKIPNNWNRCYLVSQFENPELRLSALQFLNDDENELNIVRKLPTEDLKLKALKYINDHGIASKVLRSLESTSDEDKYQFLKELENEGIIEAVIKSMTDDDIKYRSLKYLTNPSLKNDIVIHSITDKNIKIDFLSQLDDENIKKNIIISIYDDVTKLSLLNTITNDNYKFEIINKFRDNESKLMALEYIDNDEIKKRIVATSFNSDYLIFRSIKYFHKDKNKAYVIELISSPTLRLDCIYFLKDLENKTEIVSTVKDEALLQNFLIKSKDDELKVFVISMLPTEKIIKNLKYLSADDLKKDVVIKKLSKDKWEEALRFIFDEKSKVGIITRFNDDATKIKYLDIIKDRYLRALILCSLQDQELKVGLLQTKCDKVMQAFILMDSIWSYKYEVLKNFYSDIEKKEAFNYLTLKCNNDFEWGYYRDSNYDKIIDLTIKDENIKFEMLQKITNNNLKVKIICTLNDNLKIQSLALFEEENYRADIIRNLSTDKLKLEHLTNIKDLKNRLEIICSLDKDDLKLPFLNQKFNDSYNYPIIASLKAFTNRIKSFPFLKEEENQKRFWHTNLDETEKLGLANVITMVSDSSKKLEIKELETLENGLKKLENKKIMVKLLTYIFNNLNNLDLVNKSGVLIDIFSSLEYTNSLELYDMSDRFANSILTSDNPKETFKKIESIFLKNNLPTFAKIFLCFGYLYPDLKNINITEEQSSPEIVNPKQTRRMEITARNASNNTKRMQIFLNDLIRIGTHSGNRSLVSYLDNIENGDKLFKALEKGIINYDDVSLEAKEVLKIYESHLESLYSYMKKQDDLDISNLSNLEKINYLAHKFYGNDDLAQAISNSRYSLPDRIIRSFAYQAGFDTFDEFKQVVINTKKDKEKISIKRSKELENSSLQLEKGDLIRGVGNIYSIESILMDGNVCKEFLGTFVGNSTSDATPLDIDLSLIMEDGKTVSENIGNSITSNSYGNIYFVIKKDNHEINLTRNSDGSLTDNPYNPEKIELFRTLSKRHFGIRTGIAAADIDYIIYREEMENSNDLSILKNEIAKNGLYIPVVDMDGKLVFTYEEYETLKNKMNGLSYYGNKEYSLSNYGTSSYVNRLNALVEKNREDVLAKSNLVYQTLASAINQINLDGKNLNSVKGLDTELTKGNVEVLETGSSARGTNVPSDYDFDYIFRLDADIMRDNSKLIEFKTRFCEALKIPPITGDLRDVTVDIPGLGEIKLDVTIIQKNDKLEYSTEMALNDYLTTIGNNNQNARDVITANVILAKLLFKNADCYKNCRKDSNQGGLGGVGTENWIIQNGGTLESAAKSFLEVADGKTFEEFKKVYHVHDYGKNHMYRDKNLYPYDDFVYNNMNATGYEKMKNVLNKYLQYLKGDNLALPEIDKIIAELENKMSIEASKSSKTTHI